jgi:hypothetical protein
LAVLLELKQHRQVRVHERRYQFMKGLWGFLAGLISGALVGALIAILLAPMTGMELRGKIRERVDYVQNEVKNAADQRRLDLEKQLADLRAPRRPVA